MISSYAVNFFISTYFTNISLRCSRSCNGIVGKYKSQHFLVTSLFKRKCVMQEVNKRDPIYQSTPLKETPLGQRALYLDHDLSFQFRYLNHSGRTVSIGLRNGLVIPLPSRADRYKKTVLIREEIFISDRIKNKVRDALLNYDGVRSDDLIAFGELFHKEYEIQPHHVTLRYDYDIATQAIIDSGGSIYLIERDIILSTEQDNIPLHPFCSEALSKPLSVANRQDGSATVCIVDNRRIIGPRYMRLLNRVVKIEATSDPLRPDGVYVTHRNLVSDNQTTSSFDEYIPIVEIENQTWLFKTFAEAKSAPERELELNIELKQLDHDSKRIAASSNVRKSEYDLEKIKLERQNAVLQQELTENNRRHAFFENDLNRRFSHEEYQSKLDNLRSKDYYESRSSERKDSSEWVKIIPAMLVGAGAAFIALKGLFTK